MFERTYIGLDVHAQSIVACALNRDTGVIERAKMNADPVAVLDWIQKQEEGAKVVYEAGPTGLGLARFLLEHGIECIIAEHANSCEYAGVINALKCFRGIDTTTAYSLAVEIGDWTRFTGSSIGSYLGLVPSEHYLPNSVSW